MRQLLVRRESFPIRGTFTISRGSKTEAEVILVEIAGNGARGRGESVPYRRYGETVEGVLELIEKVRPAIEAGAGRADLASLGLTGAACNAVDCALWDLEAKQSGRPVHELAGLPAPVALTTAYTLSLGTPEAMERAAREAARRPLLKVKLGGEGDIERMRAVRAGAPHARLIVDANEAWRPEMIEPYGAAMAELGVEMIEQPLPAGADQPLAGLRRAVPFCADESAHDRAGLARLKGLYELINIKLDKTGGLTEAIALARAAEAQGFGIMLGCMVGTSLSMAPATLLGSLARFVDLDGPLLLAHDRDPGLRYEGSLVHPPESALWG
ncbi:MAG: dipeptide epimerase [Alphaproteobacteria bacterium]|nr:dipeptide epimerase [Alphaproteobacteria bacterium]